MNVYTRQDLSIMQAWPLERKIRVTQAKIPEWHHHYGGKIAVSFSGGKDSTVLLDLVRRAFPDVPAVFLSPFSSLSCCSFSFLLCFETILLSFLTLIFGLMYSM